MTENADNPSIVPEVRTLLATDFVSSTKLVEQIGDEAAAAIFAQHDRLIRDLALKHQGLEIDKTDGFLFLFSRPRDATLFAMQYHDALAVLSKDLEQALSARIGIHLGEVVLRPNNPDDVKRGAKPIEVEGLAKHLVARVMSLATSHQTLLTGPPFQLARRAHLGESPYPEDTAWIKHGHYALKGIDEPVLVYEVGRRSVAPLTVPPSTEKARRVRAREVSTYDGEPKPGRKRRFLAVPVMLALLFIGAGYFVESKEKADERTRKAAALRAQSLSTQAKDKRKEATALREVKISDSKFILHLVSRPAGALFEVVDGAILGTAPTSLELSPERRQLTLRASLAGYETANVLCVVTEADIKRGSGICTAELVMRPSKPVPRPNKPAKTLSEYKDNPFAD